jgi:aspartyl-tRNA synthetase
MENPSLATGAVEVRCQQLEVLNAARTPPFEVDQRRSVDETLRLKHRYIDLRTERMQKNLRLRHAMAQATREFLNSRGFWEVETPFLIKSTPEGARDFIVPSRLQPGSFYALPQSPQLLKQILMVSGVERYYQLARCLRDEDLRADRQPEFTQIDIEMSFVDEGDVFGLCEGLVRHVFKAAGDCPGQGALPAVPSAPFDCAPFGSAQGKQGKPFRRMTYAEAMLRYGTDKPDLRFGLEIQDVSDLVRETSFTIFRQALDSGGVVRALRAPGAVAKASPATPAAGLGAGWPKREKEELSRLATSFGAPGLITIACGEESAKSAAAKYLTQAQLQKMAECVQASEGDLVLCVAGPEHMVAEALGRLRLHLGERLSLAQTDRWEFVWIVEFPLLTYNEQEGRIEGMHHPFTSPMEQDLALLDSEPLKVRARLYDLVLNGHEIASGSIRIHRRDIQQKVFQAIGMSEQEANERFGFLLEALEYGAPPHGGIAFGFDRMVAIAAGEESIRDVIAFPKTSGGTDPLTGSPSPVDEKQLKELGLDLR